MSAFANRPTVRATRILASLTRPHLVAVKGTSTLVLHMLQKQLRLSTHLRHMTYFAYFSLIGIVMTSPAARSSVLVRFGR